MNWVVVGTQWGDEGKGKIVDLLSEEADAIVRYQGGHNAGHTVVIGDQTFVLHLLPTGLLWPGKMGILGNGVVIDPAALLSEIRALTKRGLVIEGRLLISESAHVILPYHRALERESEKIKGARRIGTTERGIGPAYADKVSRIGIRMIDLMEPEVFREKLNLNLVEVNHTLAETGTEPFDFEQIYQAYLNDAAQLKSYMTNTSEWLYQACTGQKKLLFEGAQGTHLDVDFGTYPYVTSSSASAGGACTGTGIGPTQIDGVIGVAKAYTTRVGGGPFPSELIGEAGDRLRARGGEFGATTGRPRRCGWFDAVLARHAVRVNGLTALAVTKLDVLDGLPELNLCVGYRFEDRIYTEMPASSRILEKCTPIYETFPGWTASTSGLTAYTQLPSAAKQYIEALCEKVGCPLDIVSTGARRTETIVLHHPFRPS